MAGEAAASALRFFLDRGLGARIVPQALREAGLSLETMDERYGKAASQNIQDTQWIEEAALAGDVLLCKDLAIAHNTLEAQVVYMTSARVFALSSGGSRKCEERLASFTRASSPLVWCADEAVNGIVS